MKKVPQRSLWVCPGTFLNQRKDYMAIQHVYEGHDDDPDQYLAEKINEIIDVVNALVESLNGKDSCSE